MHHQVLLSEIYTDPGGARVVVKELKANASAKEQNDFLQQGDPYRWIEIFFFFFEHLLDTGLFLFLLVFHHLIYNSDI